MGYVGCVVRVSCFFIGLLGVAQSCCVIIAVFRVACFTSNVSAVGLLTQGVDTVSINQSFKKSILTQRSYYTVLLNVAMSRGTLRASAKDLAAEGL
jgi:hypothetical protein